MKRDRATENQVRAADPASSVWVSANAGSGKTKVLTDRVARLLLNGVEPQNILCLTYTKAAATEMQNRLFKRLGAWSMMETSRLRDSLRVLGHEGVLTDETVAQARRLFAEAIETPGGLKIQTIHSFCSSVLRRFPLEAGVSPQFREMEEQTAKQLRQDVLDDLADSKQAELLKAVYQQFTCAEFDKLLKEIVGNKNLLRNAPTDEELRAQFGVPRDQTTQTLLDNVFSVGAVDLLKSLIAVLKTGGPNDSKAGARLETIDLENPRLQDLVVLESVFLFKDTKERPFTAKRTFITKSLAEKHRDLIDQIWPMMLRVEDTRQPRLSFLAYQRSKPVMQLAGPFINAYEAEKRARGWLDFDDLIGKAKTLLSNSDVAQWVLFRLDGHIDHVLVDEAQDTSPDQWAVIKALTTEFASGSGARADTERTLFFVGDKQQSIYSFQGADPKEFDRVQSYFETALGRVNKRFDNVKLSHSFRSSQVILTAVDQTFTGDRAKAIGKVQDHVAFHESLPGRVDLWPFRQ